MKTLIDTNILVYAHDSASSYQKSAAELVRNALEGRFEAVISIQNIAELYSVLTNRKRVKSPLSPEDAYRICKLYLVAAEIPKLVPDETTMLRALELASEQNMVGGDFFDCLLAATMEHFKVKHIFTENITDFQKLAFIESTFPLKSKKQTL
ncbi:MAG: type II toxin-antitoxin system VapC family toxin [Nitrososphaerales archaeon]